MARVLGDATAAEARERPVVLLLGPLPPPVHGLAMVTGWMAQRLGQHARVLSFDVGGPLGDERPPLRGWRRVRWLAVVWWRLCRQLRDLQPIALFIGGSAGPAMAFDALAATTARWAGVPVYLHHHSFACLEDGTRRWYHRLSLAAMRRDRHIVLCEHMGQRLVQRQGIAPRRIVVLSNALFIDASPLGQAGTRLAGELRLGFFSNISRSKGILAYFDLVARLQAAGHGVTAWVAGPLDGRVDAQFHQRLAASPGARYLGALAGDAKQSFYGSLDLLVLPTRHPHEAEPLVLIEALSHGVPVLCTRRGCIANAWADGRAVHALEEGTFVEQAAAAMAPWLASAVVRADWRDAAHRHHARGRVLAEAQWQSLVGEAIGAADRRRPPPAG